MDKILELEAKVKELEKRIIFLYKMIEKQNEINEQVIKNHGKLQDKVFQYTNATNRNTEMLNMLGVIIKERES